ncbi:MAG TPA: hypothetical protein VKY26_07770 [Actinomycetota bacterium]|nr:hypothetical protein [Actinomycetota bacterium]
MAVPTPIGRNRRHLIGRRGRAAAATLAVLVTGAVAAYAEFSGSGPGPGGPVAAGSAAIAIPSSTVGPLTPQINPADTTPITVTVDNPGPGALTVGEITGQVRQSSGCQSAWFTVASVAAPGSLAPGQHTYASSVILNDNDRDQKACASQKQTIDWAAH